MAIYSVITSGILSIAGWNVLDCQLNIRLVKPLPVGERNNGSRQGEEFLRDTSDGIPKRIITELGLSEESCSDPSACSSRRMTAAGMDP